MRQQFVSTVSRIMGNDERLVVLLGDIGVWGFRDAFHDYPTRIYNIGILEQATIGVASGLALGGFIPVVHTIAPFLVERAYEQLKLDFGYQNLNGNFVSVGASYDYAALGCTHHCPGDIGVLKNIPTMNIIVPGTASEFDTLFRQVYAEPFPKYYRLTEESNEEGRAVEFGKAILVKKGKQAIVIAIGPMLQPVLEATHDKDVTILYYTTIKPFDVDTIRQTIGQCQKIVVCEPCYTGSVTEEIMEACKPIPVRVDHIGIPHKFLTSYGTGKEYSKFLGLDTEGIRKKIDFLISSHE